MGARQRDWARRKRDELRVALGGKCVVCGTDEDLEFDVKNPTLVEDPAEHHRKMDWSHRMSFYRQQHAANNLQLLCSPCNSRKGDNVPTVNALAVERN